MDEQIACQQVMMEDSAVHSVQWVDFPLLEDRTITPEWLLERYLRHIRRFTLTLVRPRRDAEGIAFSLLGTSLALLRFREPVPFTLGEERSLALSICGGFLVQKGNCQRGEISFRCLPLEEKVRVTVLLTDFCPLLLGGEKPSRWRRLLYRWSQALLHKLVTVGFLRRLYQETAPPGACCRVVKVSPFEGEEI